MDMLLVGAAVVVGLLGAAERPEGLEAVAFMKVASILLASVMFRLIPHRPTGVFVALFFFVSGAEGIMATLKSPVPWDSTIHSALYVSQMPCLGVALLSALLLWRPWLK